MLGLKVIKKKKKVDTGRISKIMSRKVLTPP